MSARTRRTAYPSIAAVAAFVALRLATAGGAPEDPSLPFAETPYVLGDSIGAYESFMMSGGPPPDGIPAIEEPRFIAAAQADLKPGDAGTGRGSWIGPALSRSSPWPCSLSRESRDFRV